MDWQCVTVNGFPVHGTLVDGTLWSQQSKAGSGG